MNFLPYDFRKGNTLELPPVHSTCHGINSPLFWDTLHWNNLLGEMKASLSFGKYNKRLKEYGALMC